MGGQAYIWRPKQFSQHAMAEARRADFIFFIFLVALVLQQLDLV